MEKPVKKPLYKPQMDSVDINVNVYVNELCDNTNCPSGCTINKCVVNNTLLCW
jgi:hypothetical protein